MEGFFIEKYWILFFFADCIVRIFAIRFYVDFCAKSEFLNVAVGIVGCFISVYILQEIVKHF